MCEVLEQISRVLSLWLMKRLCNSNNEGTRTISYDWTPTPYSLKSFLKIHHSHHRAEDRDLGEFGRKHGSVQTGKIQLHNDWIHHLQVWKHLHLYDLLWYFPGLWNHFLIINFWSDHRNSGSVEELSVIC